MIAALTSPRHLGAVPRSGGSAERNNFCLAWQNKGNELFFERAQSPEFRLHFGNSGLGILQGGGCWWMSRLERAAYHLAVFRPDLPRPTHEQAKGILWKLARGEEVVEIPGYSSLLEFTRVHENEAKSLVNEWQTRDGVLRQAWVTGLTGRSETDPDHLKRTMDELYSEVTEQRRIPYLKIQLPKLSVHSLLVLSMDRTEEGYLIHYRDPNSRGIETLRYTESDRSLTWPSLSGNRPMLPYIEHRDDYRRFDAAIERYCSDVGAR